MIKLFEKIAKTITQKREVLGWTQTKLGNVANVTQTTVSRLENGMMNIKLKDFLSIIIALNLTPNEMMFNEVDILKNYKFKLHEARTMNDYYQIETILSHFSKQEIHKNQELYVLYHFYTALLLINQEKYMNALEKIDIALKRLKINDYTLSLYAELLFTKGTLLYQLNEDGQLYYEEARQIINDSKITYDNYEQVVKLHYNLAMSFCRQQKYRVALEELKKANVILNSFHSTFKLLEIEFARLIFYKNIDHEQLEAQKQCVEVLMKFLDSTEIKPQYKKLFIYE